MVALARRSAIRVVGLATLAFTGCYTTPDVAKLICASPGHCPQGYVCVIPPNQIQGSCKRPIDGGGIDGTIVGDATVRIDGIIGTDGVSPLDSSSMANANDSALDQTNAGVDLGFDSRANSEAGGPVADHPGDIPLVGPETGIDGNAGLDGAVGSAGEVGVGDGNIASGAGGSPGSGGSGGSGGSTATGGTGGPGGTMGTGGRTGTGGMVGTGGSPILPPTITAQPADITVVEGNPATFTIAASGSGTLTYQWYQVVSGVDYALGAGTSLPISTSPGPGSPTPPYTNNYYCVVTDGTGHTTKSRTATLTVNPVPAPTITTQPADATVVVGTSANFTIAATGSGTLTYQWYQIVASVDYKLGTGTSLLISTSPGPGSPTPPYANNYYCIVTDGSGNTTRSRTATLTVNP